MNNKQLKPTILGINHLISGIPRSGTTLLTSTLSSSSQVVVFSEPEWLKTLRTKAHDATSFTQQLTHQIAELRVSVEKKHAIQLKSSHFQKGQPANYYIRGEQGKIISDKSEYSTLLDPGLYKAPFIIKSNAQFTACLKQLIDTRAFKIHCIIRNPVAVVMSWRSLDIPVSHGNMKIAEKYSPEYLSFIKPAKTLLEKQVLMVDWYFSEFHKYQSEAHIIKYENMLNNMEQLLQEQFHIDDAKLPKTRNQNKSKHYDLSEANEIKACFLSLGVHYKYYYPTL